MRNSDPVLAGIIERVGRYRMVYRDPDFQTLVRSIVFQQLNGKAATTIFDRLAGACPRQRLTPGAILRLSDAEMRAAGLSKQKLAYIRDLAERTRAGSLRFPRLAKLSDEQVIESLTAVKGIGEWTAHMFLIFALRRPDVLPTGDYGIRSAIRKAYAFEELPKPAEIERVAQPWRPYASVASWYLWRSLDGQVEL